MALFGASSKKKNKGPAYICECPSCKEIATFELVQIIESILILVIPVFKASDTHHLACNKCDKLFILAEEEIRVVEQLLPKYGSNEEFVSACKSTKINSIYREEVYQTLNVCKSCKEESPGNIALCWNCGEEIEEAILDGNGEYEYVVDPLFGSTTMRKDVEAEK